MIGTVIARRRTYSKPLANIPSGRYSIAPRSAVRFGLAGAKGIANSCPANFGVLVEVEVDARQWVVPAYATATSATPPPLPAALLRSVVPAPISTEAWP